MGEETHTHTHSTCICQQVAVEFIFTGVIGNQNLLF